MMNKKYMQLKTTYIINETVSELIVNVYTFRKISVTAALKFSIKTYVSFETLTSVLTG